MEEVATDRTDLLIDGRYRIVSALGAGAMASVYEATDEKQSCQVAIKVLKDEVRERSTFQERFEREVLISSKLHHPSCIQIFDFGTTEDGLPYQVMELVPGRSLAELLDQEETLEPIRALHIFKQLLYALGECGDAGVIHRDVKPENILIYASNGERDCLKLIDFGISKLIGDAAVGHEKLTSVGLILGTPHYIAPEWVTRDDVDARSDLYSASILLFEMLTSAPPFLSDDRRELMKMHLRQTPPSLKERAPEGHFSEALEEMLRKGLSKEPENRFSDARDYLRALKALSGESLSNDELKVRSKEPTAAQPYTAVLPPAPDPAAPMPATGGPAPASFADPPVFIEPPAARHPVPASARGATHAIASRPGQKRLSPKVMVAIGVALVAALIAVAMLDGDRSRRGAAQAIERRDAGKQVTHDAEPSVLDDKPPKIEVVPINDSQVAVVTDAWTAEGLQVSGFKGDLGDARSNGACSYGQVESIRVLLCLAEHDPVKQRKPVRRRAPGDDKPRKWRARIRIGELHLRVESTSKKEAATRRRIERVFRKL